jgi:hypothetical protein
MLAALRHLVRLILAQHVNPFVKRSKNAGHAAEAISEAVSRPGMPMAARAQCTLGTRTWMLRREG